SAYDYRVSATLYQYAGTATALGLTIPSGSDFWIDTYFNGSSSLHGLNGNTPLTGNPGTNNSTSQPVIGGISSTGADGWSNRIYFVAISPASIGTTGRTNYAAY